MNHLANEPVLAVQSAAGNDAETRCIKQANYKFNNYKPNYYQNHNQNYNQNNSQNSSQNYAPYGIVERPKKPVAGTKRTGKSNGPNETGEEDFCERNGSAGWKGHPSSDEASSDDTGSDKAKASQMNRSKDNMRQAAGRIASEFSLWQRENMVLSHKKEPLKENWNETDEMDDEKDDEKDDQKDKKIFSDSTEPAEGSDELCEAIDDEFSQVTNDATTNAITKVYDEVYDEPSAVSLSVSGVQSLNCVQIMGDCSSRDEQYASARAVPCHASTKFVEFYSERPSPARLSPVQRQTAVKSKQSESNELNVSNEASLVDGPSWDAHLDVNLDAHLDVHLDASAEETTNEDQVHNSPSSFLLNEFESILRWVNAEKFSFKTACFIEMRIELN